MNANQLPDADDFRALSDDVRKRRERNRLPEMKPEHVISGCGPGIAQPADTPQHGVRSVLMRERAKMESELWDMLAKLYIQPRRTSEDFRTIARLAQGVADRAHLLAGMV